jgi:hypothetical protein
MGNESDRAFPDTTHKENHSTHAAYILLIEKSQRLLYKRTKFQTVHGCPIPKAKDDSSLPVGKGVELVSGMDQDATTQYFGPASTIFRALQRY